MAGFNDSWIPTTLSAISSYRKTHRTSTKKNYVSTENILQNYQGIERFTSDESVSGDGFNCDDILMGNIRPYLKKVCLANFDGVCNADVLVFKSESVNPRFLHCILANDNFINYVMSSVKGSKMPRGDKGHIMQYPLSIPRAEEQAKIADFIALLNERIDTQSKIIEEIETLKKAICNKIFGNPNWEKYRVGDIGTLGRGRVISTSEINSSVNPKYPVYSSQTSNNGVMGYIDTYEFDGEYITWTTDGANAGTVFYRNGKFNCTNVCGTIKLNNMVDAYFVAYALQQAAKKYVSTNLANPKLMNNVMADICIYCPDLTTQKRISSLVRLLDEKIAIEEQILNGYKESKHYLLSNLFI